KMGNAPNVNPPAIGNLPAAGWPGACSDLWYPARYPQVSTLNPTGDATPVARRKMALSASSSLSNAFTCAGVAAWSLPVPVVGDTVNPTWLPDGRFWYARTTLTGTENVVIDPVKKTREVVPTPPEGGQASAGAGGRGGRGGGGGGRGGAGRGGVALSKTCGPNVTGMTGPPPASMSPDGSKALFICDWNLWVKDVATGQERQLTTDGAKDFGYATSNAGWTTSAAPSVSWSPDGKKIATQQQDERKVGDMYLVETPVNGGHPVLRAWKYPLPGDPDVAMISR